MRGYVVVGVDVHDQEAYVRDYVAHVLPTIERYGGRFLVRGGTTEVREGEWPWPRLVVIEFPSVDDARRWYDSDEYRPLRDVRHRLADAVFLIAEGAPPAA